MCIETTQSNLILRGMYIKYLIVGVIDSNVLKYTSFQMIILIFSKNTETLDFKMYAYIKSQSLALCFLFDNFKDLR